MAETQKTFDLQPGSRVNIEATAGDLEIRGWDRPQVAVESDGHLVAHQGEDGAVTIRGGHAGSDDLMVRVPAGCELWVRVVSGDVELADFAGKVNIQSMSGDIDATRIQGTVAIHTVSGDTELRESWLKALSIDSVSGDSVIESALDEEGSYRLTSVSGDVKLMIPEDQACTIRNHALSGEFKCRLAHEMRRQGWGTAEALVNGGGVEVQVRSTSGSLTVEAAKRVMEAGERVAQAEPVGQQSAGEGRDTKPLAEEPPDEPFGVDETAAPTQEAEENASVAERRMEILKAIEEGRLSVSDGLARLRELE